MAMGLVMRDDVTRKATNGGGVVATPSAVEKPCERMAAIRRQHEQLGKVVRKQQMFLTATRRMVSSNARA
jgi:hypothetical protein